MRLKKYIAEFLGTAILVLFGCGTAAFSGGLSGGTDNGTLGVVSIALAFGLSIVAGAYSIGHISGCHVNPATLSLRLPVHLQAAACLCSLPRRLLQTAWVQTATASSAVSVYP